MKKNKLLALSTLLACTLLAGCEENTKVQDGDKPIGGVTTGDQTLDTNLTLQKFYEDLKDSNGGSKAIEKLIDKIAGIEYSDENLAKDLTAASSDGFDVRYYHTTASLQKEIAEVFENVVDGTSYLDDNGDFDPEEFKEYVEETLDYDVKEGLTSDKYLTDSDLRNVLKYNYDEYIEKSVKPDILENYIYLDYITSSSKYKGQFSNQYAVKLEVLKIEHDTTKLNNAWNEALIKDVKAITSAKSNIEFGTTYSFVTFNSNNDLVVFNSTKDALSYDVYNLSEENVNTYVPSYVVVNGTNPIRQLDFNKSEDKAKVETLIADSTTKKVEEKSWVITPDTKPNQEYYEHIEDLLIARKLWQIDYEVILAKNYDNKTTYYDAMTETEKSEAQTFASTYSNSNTKPIKEVAKEKKISAQQEKYYSEPDYYTKNTYTNVLPSALSSLRGTSAKDLISHLTQFGDENDKFLLPTNDSLTDPVYLDTSSNNYYICEVSEWYGYYETVDILNSSKPSKQISNYQIEAYQTGVLTPWKLNDEGTRYVEDTAASIVYSQHPEGFESVINLVQISAENILTDAMKKEAIVSLFEKYSLEINDQDIYDYIKTQYPDYFEND